MKEDPWIPTPYIFYSFRNLVDKDSVYFVEALNQSHYRIALG